MNDFQTYVPKTVVQEAIESIIKKSAIENDINSKETVLIPILNGGIFIFQKILEKIQLQKSSLKLLPLRFESYHNGKQGSIKKYICSLEEFYKAMDYYGYKPKCEFETVIEIEKETELNDHIIAQIRSLQSKKIVFEDMIDTGNTFKLITDIVGDPSQKLYLFQKKNHDSEQLLKMKNSFSGLIIDNIWVAGCGADGGEPKINYRNREEILVKKSAFHDGITWELI